MLNLANSTHHTCSAANHAFLEILQSHQICSNEIPLMKILGADGIRLLDSKSSQWFLYVPFCLSSENMLICMCHSTKGSKVRTIILSGNTSTSQPCRWSVADRSIASFSPIISTHYRQMIPGVPVIGCWSYYRFFFHNLLCLLQEDISQLWRWSVADVFSISFLPLIISNHYR